MVGVTLVHLFELRLSDVPGSVLLGLLSARDPNTFICREVTERCAAGFVPVS
ncbi:hypothetical protein PISMIDRAFT_686297 [Pisolithus microcarpus 441]|uniref:Unplaced genomic scaffold scaffold_172, whole genome shotgun sequence n=1 Tax=Pisolithus microcarpus 441 TaxID=765257 RepID=A0A0C9XVR9_9AGAM|nr:hypothetical protein PISMIDRAFT_686297 [Pisolithus microcarpus 441]